MRRRRQIDVCVGKQGKCLLISMTNEYNNMQLTGKVREREREEKSHLCVFRV